MDAAELADRLEISDLLTRYATAVDRKDWDLYRTVFTADATIDYTSAGGVAGDLDTVVAWLADALGLFEMSQHLVTNIAVDLDGDRAIVTAAFFNPMHFVGGDGPDGRFFCGGWYHHRLVRTADGWRSEELREETAWTTLGG